MTTARLVRQVIDSPERILMVKPSSLGDVVHALPAVALLRKAYPEAKISWLINANLTAVAEASPYVDEIIPFNREQMRGLFGTLLNGMSIGGVLAGIRDRRFDIVVDLQGLFRSGFITCVSGAPVRVGFANGRELSHTFYNVRCHLPNRTMHAVDRYMRVVRTLGLPECPLDFSMRIDPEMKTLVEKLFAEFPFNTSGPVVVFHPYTRWPTKNWPEEYFAETGRMACERLGARIVFAGANKEGGERIAKMMGAPALNLCGVTSLKELIAVIGAADLFLTGDSGPMHIADAFGVPLVAVFGPTDPNRTGPYFQRDGVVSAGLSCAPCLSRKCKKERLECQYGVSAEMVFERIKDKLEKTE